jgi:hypothetical protein
VVAVSFLALIGINLSNSSYFLSGQENANLITEKIKKMGVKNSRIFWIELLDELVQSMEVLDSFTEHLLLGLVIDLVGFAFPVHFAYGDIGMLIFM